MSARLGRTEIEALLPHRGAALFVEEAEVDGRRVVGTARWPAEHPHLGGHFPGFPIVPGVFLIEAAAQLGGIALAASSDAPAPGERLGMLAAVRRALLHRPIYPGEAVRYSLELSPVPRGAMCLVSGTASAENGDKVLTVELGIAVAESDKLAR